MPQDPHTWAAKDFFSASILDNDLYAYQGQYYQPNGIRFHAKRPLYKAFNITTNASSLGAGTWSNFWANSNNSAGVIYDSANEYGAPMDKGANARLVSNVNGAGGGSLNGSTTRANGGIYLMSAFMPTNANVATVVAGLGTVPISSPPNTVGFMQPGNTTRLVSPFVIDIVDGASQTWTPYFYNGASSSSLTLTPYSGPDGGGWTGRFHAQWASIYEAYGATVGSAPSPLTSWTGANLTSATLNGNTGIRDALRFWNMPPLFRNHNPSTSQSISANTVTTVTLGTLGTSDYDSYSAWNSSTNTYTVPFNGLYLVHGIANFTGINGTCQVGVVINGTNYFGPGAPMTSGSTGGASKTQIFSLQAGDTIKLICETTAATTVSSSFPPRLVILYVSGQGTPGITVTPPDVSYRYAAGSPADSSAYLNAHLANDMVFLNQRPYLMARQTVAQSGISMATSTVLSMDTVGGIVHSDGGDNWSGWNSGTNAYVAPVDGWYMAVMENVMAFPTLTATPVVGAQFQLTQSSYTNWDAYGQINMAQSSYHGGGTGLAYYYLRAGDKLQAGVYTVDSSSTTISTSVGGGTVSHMEVVWVSE